MDKYNGTVQYFIFQLTFYSIFLVLLQPLPPPPTQCYLEEMK